MIETIVKEVAVMKIGKEVKDGMKMKVTDLISNTDTPYLRNIIPNYSMRLTEDCRYRNYCTTRF